MPSFPFQRHRLSTRHRFLYGDLSSLPRREERFTPQTKHRNSPTSYRNLRASRGYVRQESMQAEQGKRDKIYLYPFDKINKKNRYYEYISCVRRRNNPVWVIRVEDRESVHSKPGFMYEPRLFHAAACVYGKSQQQRPPYLTFIGRPRASRLSVNGICCIGPLAINNGWFRTHGCRILSTKNGKPNCHAEGLLLDAQCVKTG